MVALHDLYHYVSVGLNQKRCSRQNIREENKILGSKYRLLTQWKKRKLRSRQDYFQGIRS